MPARAAIRTHFQRPHLTAGDPGGGDEYLHQVSWDDPTAGLAGGTADVAFVWLPVPDPGRYSWVVVAEGACLVALPPTHRLASREVIDLPGKGSSPARSAACRPPSWRWPGAPATIARWSWTTHGHASRPPSPPSEPRDCPFTRRFHPAGSPVAAIAPIRGAARSGIAV